MWDFLTNLVSRPLDLLTTAFVVVIMVLLMKFTGLRITKKGITFVDKNNEVKTMLDMHNTKHQLFEAQVMSNSSAITSTAEMLKEVKVALAKINAVLIDVKKEQGDISKDMLRLTFYSEANEPHIPDAERLVSGLRYIRLGGNGATQKDVLKYIQTHKELYEAIIATNPDMKVRVGV